jgi:hypothetical protein
MSRVLFLRLVLLLVHVFGEDPERRSWIKEHDDAGRAFCFLRPASILPLTFYPRITHRLRQGTTIFLRSSHMLGLLPTQSIFARGDTAAGHDINLQFGVRCRHVGNR